MGSLCDKPAGGTEQRQKTQKCDCGKDLDEDSIQICDTHKFCKNCALRSLSLKTCNKCKKNLNNNQEKQIRRKYEVMCKACEEMSVYFKELVCGCMVCSTCEANSTNDNSCPICKSILKVKATEEGSNEMTCEVCYEKIESHMMLNLDCQHFFHSGCIKEFIGYLIKNESFKVNKDNGIACPSCPKLIPDYILSNILSADQNRSLTLILNPEIVECPGCSILFFPMSKRFICSCGASFCTVCKRNSSNCVCDKDEDFIITDEMSCCPGCKSAYMKDEKCDHVKCQNIKCGVEFCFQCSAYRDPTLKHGNHYHRPNCTFYNKYLGNDIYNADCSRCKYYKRLCERPKDLKRRGRFEEGER